MASNSVEHSDRVARSDTVGGIKLSEKAHHVEACQVRKVLAKQRRINAHEVALQRLIKRPAGTLAKCVENRSIELRRTKIGHQRVDAVFSADGDLRVIMRCEMAERSARDAGLQI